MTIVASGSVSAANFWVSLPNGVAHVNFNAAGVFNGYEGCKLTITDTGGDKLIGYIKAMGLAETLDTNLFVGFDFTSGWTASTSTINDADTFTLAAANGGIQKVPTVIIIGTLYKASFAATVSAGTVSLRGDGGLPVFSTNGASNTYKTAVNTTSYIYNIGGGIGATNDVTTLMMQKVLTPSATGCTIVSTAGGTTYNWTSIGASFTVNEAVTYTIERRSGGLMRMKTSMSL